MNKPSRRKILIVVNVDWAFLSHRLPIALAAQSRGYEVHIATSITGQGKNIEEFGFKLHPIPFERSKINPFSEIKVLFLLYRLYSELKPDIIHHVTIKPVLYGGMMARLARVPHVISAISGLGYIFIDQGLKAKFRRLLVRILYKIALGGRGRKVIFQNPDDRDMFLKASLLKSVNTILIRGSGVDISKFSLTLEHEGPPLIVLPARILRHKGVLEFVEAARILQIRNVQARFILVGACDMLNPAGISEEQIKGWQEEINVEWWGFKKDMYQVYMDSHIVCLPSYREGLPKSLLEAAACGRPIVTTDVPGCREVVIHNKNGLLVPVKNGPALADALERLVNAPELRRLMGIAGRKLVVDELSEEIVVDKTLKVYDTLLS
jgi:glycosyltransferase involved in cell wall biosynthesis